MRWRPCSMQGTVRAFKFKVVKQLCMHGIPNVYITKGTRRHKNARSVLLVKT